jgi:hypothetical protein
MSMVRTERVYFVQNLCGWVDERLRLDYGLSLRHVGSTKPISGLQGSSPWRPLTAVENWGEHRHLDVPQKGPVTPLGETLFYSSAPSGPTIGLSLKFAFSNTEGFRTIPDRRKLRAYRHNDLVLILMSTIELNRWTGLRN